MRPAEGPSALRDCEPLQGECARFLQYGDEDWLGAFF